MTNQFKPALQLTINCHRNKCFVVNKCIQTAVTITSSHKTFALACRPSSLCGNSEKLRDQQKCHQNKQTLFFSLCILFLLFNTVDTSLPPSVLESFVLSHRCTFWLTVECYFYGVFQCYFFAQILWTQGEPVRGLLLLLLLDIYKYKRAVKKYVYRN